MQSIELNEKDVIALSQGTEITLESGETLKLSEPARMLVSDALNCWRNTPMTKILEEYEDHYDHRTPGEITEDAERRGVPRHRG